MHFLTGEELSQSELLALIHGADQLRRNRSQAVTNYLAGKTMALMFDKPSLRTRVSFTVGIQELGGNVMELLGSQKKTEEPEDSIRVLQGMIHGLMIRTFAHEQIERMIPHATIPIINGLSNSHHPCQAIADLLTMYQRFGRLQGLKLCYIGDGNNVLHSLLLLAPYVGVDVHYACPEGYQPDEHILQRARLRALKTGAKIRKFKTPQLAARGAHVLYTDVWTSMGFEKENEERLKVFAGYQINRELFELADRHAIVMHCLPMVREQEITAEMVEHPQSAIFQQSENRLHAQKALLIGLFGAQAMRTKELEYSHVI
jgi:ornithine carbamoyltransferase